MKAVPFLCVATFLGALCSASRAFDTGHHADLIQTVLAREGFSASAIDAVKVQNWLCDYYSNSPTGEMIDARLKTDLEKLHFDNLFSTEEIGHYWSWLAYNTRQAVRQATRNDDVIQLLTLIGITTHAVQDFYSHSNWVETHPTRDGGYRNDTWFARPVNLPLLVTGHYHGPCPLGALEHGGYRDGLNKDSYVRPRWLEAYLFAYVATREWIQAMRSWSEEIEPSMWRRLRGFTPSVPERQQLENDVEAMYRISEWCADGRQQDGHWKGPGSGDKSRLVPFLTRWTNAPDSIWVRQFKEMQAHRLLTANLSGRVGAPEEAPVTAMRLQEKFVRVAITRVAEKHDVGPLEAGIDVRGRPDFYTVVTIDGQKFIDAVQNDRAEIAPAWTSVMMLPISQKKCAIKVELWDEDGELRGADDHCDINSAPNVYDLSVIYQLGSGKRTIQSEGQKPDGNRAKIEVHVDEGEIRTFFQ